jgi:hypothetical protein
MSRKHWMLPSEEAIGRSLSQQPAGRTAGGGRRTKRAVTLVCAAAVLTLLLGVVLSSLGDKDGSVAPEPETPISTMEDPPGTPFGVYGYTYAADGVTKEPSCSVNITNVNTGFYWVVASGVTGFYNAGIYGTAGDEICVQAVKGEMWGETSAEATGVYLPIDVTLDQTGEIPEFPTLVVPVVGVVALLTVVGIRRRRNIQP